MTGELNVLNVGGGDITVVFNQHDTGERAKAIRMLKDMQARGYALLMMLDDGTYTRVVDIDPKRGRYIVQVPEEDVALAGPEAEVVKKKRGRPRGPQRRSTEVSAPIEKRKVTGVARSAGG